MQVSCSRIARHAAATLLAVALAANASADPATFEKDIKPLIAKYCVSCHSAEKTKGDLNLGRFETNASVSESVAIWQRAILRMKNGEMPPGNAPQPSEEERKLIIAWSDNLKADEENCDKLATEESISWYPGYIMSRRLSRSEYENTVRDLFGMAIPVADFFPADGAGGEGFDNSGNALFISAIQAEKYLQAADHAVESALPAKRRGKAPATAANEETLKRVHETLIFERPARASEARAAARRVLAAFLERAWRRPVAHEDLERMMKMFDRAQKRGDSYDEALKLAFKAALVSPNFLFLAEPQPEQAGEYLLGGYPLASRLSYFLWSSMPDEELFAAAKAGTLHDPALLKAQVLRMLADPKASALGEVFAAQWLGITQLGVTIKPDAERFKEFDDALRASMLAEAAAYFNRLVAENRSLLELIQSDYTYANARLAQLYGLQGVESDAMQLVTLSDPNRGGVTGMAAVLTATSHPLRTSAVLRGKWVLEQLLGDRVPPPPPNVAQLPEDDKPVAGLTLRARLEAHRENPECASCHARMDPIGFGLENFDPIGRWRTEQGGVPIDANGVLPSGEIFSGPQELKGILLKRKDDFARNLARKLLGYALGRGMARFDGCVVDNCLKALQANDYRTAELFTTIALSHPFRHRYSAGTSTGGA